MQLTTYGYQNPQDDDTGEVFFPSLNFDILRLDAHSHNGIDSTLLATNSVAVTTQAIASSGWSAPDASGSCNQVVTLPSVGNGGSGGAAVQLLYAAIGIEIRLTATGERVYPKIVAASTTTYTIYTNDNSQNYTAIYTS